VETNHDVLRHLEKCTACSAELDSRTRLRSRLKNAVQRQSVPPDLQVRVREQIRSRSARPQWMFSGTRWALAAAAMLVVAVGTWTIGTQERLPALTDRPAQDRYIQRISHKIAAALSVGLKDHIHCSMFRKYGKNPPSVEQMAKTMGPAYGGLVQMVKANVPEEYRVIMAHQCGYKGRKYVHLTLQNGKHLMSLVIARREDGETLRDLVPALRPSGIPVYQSAANQFEVAAFEAGQYLAFVISDMGGGKNLQIAGSLAPAVHRFLSSLG
jgi:hypothetical protein